MSDLVPEYPLQIMQGADRTVTFTITDNNDNAFDLTGYTAKLEIRSKPGNSSISSLTSTPAAGLTINAAAGQIVAAWTAAQTALFNFSKARYDLFITASGGTKTCVIRGDVDLIERVTQ